MVCGSLSAVGVTWLTCWQVGGETFEGTLEKYHIKKHHSTYKYIYI